MESAAASAEEKAAREFQGVEGIGEATAMALAYTKALGGAQHASLASLQDWVRQSGGQCSCSATTHAWREGRGARGAYCAQHCSESLQHLGGGG